MKNSIQTILFACLLSVLISSCKKSDNSSTSDNIFYSKVNKQLVLIRDVKTLQNSDDEISNHIDSIINGWINTEVISTGIKSIDLNNDGKNDLNFEIIDLNKFNPKKLPESFDSLAARVEPVSIQILDNSTFGYPDALDVNDTISGDGSWSDRTSVLGTFANAGQFQGKGEKYLGFRFNEEGKFNYGWIKIYCSEHNDTIKIIDYAYNKVNGSIIKAGQKE